MTTKRIKVGRERGTEVSCNGCGRVIGTDMWNDYDVSAAHRHEDSTAFEDRHECDHCKAKRHRAYDIYVSLPAMDTER